MTKLLRGQQTKLRSQLWAVINRSCRRLYYEGWHASLEPDSQRWFESCRCQRSQQQAHAEAVSAVQGANLNTSSVTGTNASTVAVKSAPANFSFSLFTPCSIGPHSRSRSRYCIQSELRHAKDFERVRHDDTFVADPEVGQSASRCVKCLKGFGGHTCIRGNRHRWRACLADGHGQLLLVDAGVQVEYLVGVLGRLSPGGKGRVTFLPQELSTPETEWETSCSAAAF